MPTLNLALFGPPGSGKGTQSDFLKEKLDFGHIASGDLLRFERNSGSDLGRLVGEYIAKGELVPDRIVDELVEKHVRQHVSENRCIVFDGYPRTLGQLQRLEEMLQGLGTDLHLAISLDIAEDALIERMTSRRICSNCRTVYNLITHPPKVEGVCDKCCGPLRQRVDDQPETIRHRLEEYHRQTEPILEYLEGSGILHRIEADQPIEAISKEIQGAIHSYRPDADALEC